MKKQIKGLLALGSVATITMPMAVVACGESDTVYTPKPHKNTPPKEKETQHHYELRKKLEATADFLKYDVAQGKKIRYIDPNRPHETPQFKDKIWDLPSVSTARITDANILNDFFKLYEKLDKGGNDETDDFWKQGNKKMKFIDINFKPDDAKGSATLTFKLKLEDVESDLITVEQTHYLSTSEKPGYDKSWAILRHAFMRIKTSKTNIEESKVVWGITRSAINKTSYTRVFGIPDITTFPEFNGLTLESVKYRDFWSSASGIPLYDKNIKRLRRWNDPNYNYTTHDQTDVDVVTILVTFSNGGVKEEIPIYILGWKGWVPNTHYPMQH